MIKQRRPYSIALVIFALLSVLSICLLLIFILTADSSDGPSSVDPPASEVDDKDNNLLVVISLLSSVTSLVGFVSTTVLGWREELREGQEAALERQRQELEIEKLRLELGRSRSERDDT